MLKRFATFEDRIIGIMIMPLGDCIIGNIPLFIEDDEGIEPSVVVVIQFNAEPFMTLRL